MHAVPPVQALSPASCRRKERSWAEIQMQLLDRILEARVAERTGELQARYEQEHRLAQLLQQALLLDTPPTRFPGLAVASLSAVALPEALIGGDFCDAFSLGPDTVALVLGDVCGKGLVAAIHVPKIKFALRAFLREDPSPSRGLARLNASLCGDLAGTEASFSVLAAVSVVVLNCHTGEGVCGLAGADAPLLIRAEGHCDRLFLPGLTLGAEAGWDYQTHAFRLQPGDVLLMATDGILEARYEDVFLGYEGMAGLAAQACAMQSPASDRLPAIGQAVLDGARQFAGGMLHDDASLLLAERCLS